jgi:hypothetical protein
MEGMSAWPCTSDPGRGDAQSREPIGPGDELQIVHHLLLGAVAAMPVADFPPLLQEKEAF